MNSVQLAAALGRVPEIKVTHLSRSHQWIVPDPTIPPTEPFTKPYSRFDQAWHSIPPLFWLARVMEYWRYETAYTMLSRFGKPLRRMAANVSADVRQARDTNNSAWASG